MQEERKMIFQHVPKYIESTPDKKFRQDPETYLNKKSWNNEIIIDQPIYNSRNIDPNRPHSSESLSDPCTSFNNNFNGVNKSYRNEAQRRNAECVDLKQLSLAILSQK